MGKRANPAVIGGFIVGAVVLCIIGVLLFGRLRLLTDKQSFVLYFDSSVDGLNIGAPVDFQGVRIGSVTDIRVQYVTGKGEFRIPVVIEIEPDRIQQIDTRRTEAERRQFLHSLIERGLRAQLGMQSLVTGQLFVQLGFHPDTPVRLVGGENGRPELPTIPNPLQQASQEAQDLLARIPAAAPGATLRQCPGNHPGSQSTGERPGNPGSGPFAQQHNDGRSAIGSPPRQRSRATARRRGRYLDRGP